MKSLFFTQTGRLRPMVRLGIFVCFLILAFIAVGLFNRIIGLPPWIENGVVQPFPQLTIALLVLAAILGVLALHLRGFENRTLTTVGLPLSSPWLKSVALGLLIGVFNISFFVGILHITGHVEVVWTQISGVDILLQILPALVALAALSGWEEIALRGYGLQMLSEAFGYRVAAIITGFIFGFMHWGNPDSNIQGLLYTALGGILLAWIILRTGSLWLVWGYHAGWNIIAAIGFGLKVSGVVLPGSLLQTKIIGEDWLTGGSYGFEGSVLMAAIEIVVLFVVVIFASRLPGHRDLIGYFVGNLETEEEPQN